MNQHRPFILISNADGYDSNGIRILVDMIKDIADILVCAPDSGRSGFSCAFSATKYLVLNRQENIDDVEVWSCNGTPVDCVKLAIDQLCDGRKPDMVIGGINHGDNSTVNNHYSGTVGVALEGCLKYIPSIAFSSCFYDIHAPASLKRYCPYWFLAIGAATAANLAASIQPFLNAISSRQATLSPCLFSMTSI